MNKDCNIARDLMPLVIDGAASDDSYAFVREHIQHCVSCKDYFCGMKDAFNVTEKEQQWQEEEKKLLAAAAHSLKKRRRIRALKAVLIGAAAALIFIYCGVLLLSHLVYTPSVPLPADQIQVSLHQMSNGEVYMQQTALNAGFYIEWHESTEMTDGKRVLSLQAKEPRLTLRRQETGSSCTGILSNIQDYDLIRSGREGAWEIVWEKGQPLAAASEALENY